MSLESLADPLSSLRYLPRGMNFATAEEVAVNDAYWAATHQYVKNDVALSSVDDGAYIFLGGTTNVTTAFGGADPSADPDWVSLKPSGVNTLSGPIVPVATGGATAAYTMTVNSLTGLSASTTWCVSWQCTATKAIALVAADFIKWTLTAGANSATICQVPVVDGAALSSTCANSVVLTLPALTTTIVLTGSTAAASTSSVLTITGARLSAVQLS